MTPTVELRERIRRWGRDLGLSRVGFAPPREPEDARERLLRWLLDGRHASMGWMEREPERRVSPDLLLPGCRSIVVAALDYRTEDPVPAAPGLPRISRYAQGEDYHEVLGGMLRRLRDRILAEAPGTRSRIACDTSPVADKAFARAGGLGWIGKNSCLLHPRAGSWFFLGEIFLDLDLPPDPEIPDRCGTCTRCLDACPTDAFPEPYVLDARRCIAYWNVEHRGPFPDGWDERIGDWLVGCDVCQEVCPWNRKAPLTEEPRFRANPAVVGLGTEEWERMSAEECRALLRGSAASRIKPEDMRRNARAVSRNRRATGSGGEAGPQDGAGRSGEDPGSDLG